MILERNYWVFKLQKMRIAGKNIKVSFLEARCPEEVSTAIHPCKREVITHLGKLSVEIKLQLKSKRCTIRSRIKRNRITNLNISKDHFLAIPNRAKSSLYKEKRAMIGTKLMVLAPNLKGAKSHNHLRLQTRS